VARKLTPAQRIKAWREARGLTIRALADESDLYKSSVHRMETGDQEPRESDLQALTKGLRVTIAEFYDDAALDRAVAARKAA
jgi:transcriptional regulator with XRE-family HTH domain